MRRARGRAADRGGEPDPLARARRVIAAQALLGVLAGVLVVGLVTFGIVMWGQRTATDTELEQLLRSGSTTGVPPGRWVVVVEPDGTRSASDAAPAWAPSGQQQRAARAAGTSGSTAETTTGGREYLVRTVVTRGRTVQAAVDLAAQEDERHRLLVGLGLAALVAGGLAAWLGNRLARRSLAAWDEALERQDRFVADASHELRTPLTRLALRAGLLDDGLRHGEPRAALAGEAALLRQEASTMGEVLEDLLHAAQLGARADAGELVDLGDVARTVVELDSLRASERGLRVVGSIRPVPPVRGAEVALRRALDALVDNALRHAESEVEVGVHAEQEAGGERVVLTVTDDGPGLPADGEDLLFDRFARGQGDDHGFGLGLALVRDVAQRHGGTVRAERAPHHGTRFVISIPAEALPH